MTITEGISPKDVYVYSSGSVQFFVIQNTPIPEDSILNPASWSSSLGAISSGGLFNPPQTSIPLTGSIIFTDLFSTYNTHVFVLPVTGESSQPPSGAIIVTPISDIQVNLSSVNSISVAWPVIVPSGSTYYISITPYGDNATLVPFTGSTVHFLNLNPNTYIFRGLSDIQNTDTHSVTITRAVNSGYTSLITFLE